MPIVVHPSTQLEKAIRASSLSLVIKALRAGASLHHPNSDYKLPFGLAIDELIASVMSDDPSMNTGEPFSIVRTLLDAGAPFRDCDGAREDLRRTIEDKKTKANQYKWWSVLEDTMMLLDRVVDQGPGPYGATKFQMTTTVVPEATAPYDVFNKLLCSEKYSDVKFVFESGVSLLAHKCVLAAASPYFDARFQEASEKEEQPAMLVLKTKHPFPVVKAVIGYIYTGDSMPLGVLLEKKREYQLALLEIAVLYQLRELQGLVEVRLDEGLTVDTLQDTLRAAERHGSKYLKRACSDWVQLNAYRMRVFQSLEGEAEASETVMGNKRQKTGYSGY